MARIPYKNGVISGEAAAFDQNGNKLYSMKFVNNKLEGTRTAYYSDGKIKYVKNYKNGIWDGKTYKEYDENGLLKYEIRDEGYVVSYRQNIDGTMTNMSESEKNLLLKRIDNRDAEKQDMERLTNLKPQPKPIF